ncbi:MAG: Trk system potassium transporter TrkA, partial [Clostridia bacterium]|nr:Trk system potassium transporter TrkA [Clostridia bacterium]
IVIAGCGKIGRTVISSLSAEGHSITAIDINQKALDEVTDIFDVMTVCGNAADSDVLEEASIEKVDLFIALSGSDEINMLSCFIAKRMGASYTVARIRNPEYNDQSLGLLRLHLDLAGAVNPDYLAARELYNILKLPSAANVETFSRRNLEMIELRLKAESVLSGMRLMDMRKKYPGQYLVGVVQREDKVYIPDGNFCLEAGDKIGITASPSELHKLLKSLGTTQKQAKSVMIVGAGRTCFYLAKMLLTGGSNVTIIEKDLKRCNEMSEALRGAVIIHGDGANQDLLLEAGLENTDAFLSLTGMDEENILLSYYASTKNVPKVIPKVNRDEFALIAEKMGLDTVIAPRKIASNVFVAFARALKNSLGSKIETLYKLMDGKAEALEFDAQEDESYARIPLKDLKLKPNTLVAGIIRGKKTIIPMGSDTILPGDKVVILTAGKRMNDLADIVK